MMTTDGAFQHGATLCLAHLHQALRMEDVIAEHLSLAPGPSSYPKQSWGSQEWPKEEQNMKIIKRDSKGLEFHGSQRFKGNKVLAGSLLLIASKQITQVVSSSFRKISSQRLGL